MVNRMKARRVMAGIKNTAGKRFETFHDNA